MDSNMMLTISFTGFMLSIKLSCKFTQDSIKFLKLALLLTCLIFCSNTPNIWPHSREQFCSARFRIDIIRMARFTQLCIGQQCTATNMLRFSWMKRYISNTWVDMGFTLLWPPPVLNIGEISLSRLVSSLHLWSNGNGLLTSTLRYGEMDKMAQKLYL